MTDKPFQAVLAHHMPGRARLRIENIDGDENAVLRLGRALADHPAVRETRPNPNARSVLILHTGELAPILQDAQARGLLVVSARSSTTTTRTPLRRIKRAIEDVDQSLLDQTDHTLGLGSIAFVALAAAGVWQALNGRLLPAGTTLFNYALGMLQWGAEREPPTSEVRGS